MSKAKAFVLKFGDAEDASASLELTLADVAKQPEPKPKLGVHRFNPKSQPAKNQHRMPQAKLKQRIRRRP